ncbi:MAG TPA: hypothetical protein VIH10_05645 [Kribbella sp.]
MVQSTGVVLVPFGRVSEQLNFAAASSAWKLNVAVRLTVLAGGAVSITAVGPVGVVAAASGAAPAADDRGRTAGGVALPVADGVAEGLADGVAG